MVHASALEQFEKNDVELTVPASEPRPILIIVMVSASVMCVWTDEENMLISLAGPCFMVCDINLFPSFPAASHSALPRPVRVK